MLADGSMTSVWAGEAVRASCKQIQSFRKDPGLAPRISIAGVASVALYGCESWCLDNYR